MRETSRQDALVIVGAAAYVVVAGVSMSVMSYDVWGVFLVAPLLGLVTLPLLRRTFRGSHAVVLPWAFGGLVAKFVGTLLRYWVAFGAYGGAADANRYHSLARDQAGLVRSGDISVLDVLPTSVGTPFVQEFTATLYTVIGSSRLTAFVVFSWFGYLGLVMFVKAALVAVPRLSRRRYAAMVFFAPSLIYWPSSIGKETLLCFGLGMASLGTARILVGRWGGLSLPLAAGGLGFAAFVRPHIVAVWLVGMVVGLAMVVVLPSRIGAGRRVSLATWMVVGLLGLSVVISTTLGYLDPGTDDEVAITERVSSIFEETERRTSQGGSAITPIAVSGPQDWPYAVTRTLTRPMLFEVTGVADLIPAVEMSALLVLAALSWRRFLGLPGNIVRTPYLMFAVVVLVLFGIAFANVGNLGLLVRQRSLVMPFFLLLWCVVPRPRVVATSPEWLVHLDRTEVRVSARPTSR